MALVAIGHVLEWSPASPPADVVVSSFGMKTLNHEQQRRLAHQAGRRLFIRGDLDAFFGSLRAALMFDLNWLIPLIGRMLLGNPDCYRMLGVYTEAFGNTSYFVQSLRDAGLDVVQTSYFFGCATGARGIKPIA